MKRGMLILVLIVWFCASFGKCKAQSIQPTRDSVVINGKRYKDTAQIKKKDSLSIWVIGNAGDPVQKTIAAQQWRIIPKQNVVISWDTTEIIYIKQHTGAVGWDANASVDTIMFRIPPKVIKIGDGIYKTLFLNGHWVLLWDPKSK